MPGSPLRPLGTLAAAEKQATRAQTRVILWGHGQRGLMTTTVAVAMLGGTAEKTRMVLTVAIPTKDNESGTDHRVIGAIPKAGMKMIVSPAGQQSLGLRETRRRARLGTAGLGNGGEQSRHLRGEAVTSRPRHMVMEAINGATGCRLRKQTVKQMLRLLLNRGRMIGKRYAQRIRRRSTSTRAPVDAGRRRRRRPPGRYARM